MNEIEEKLWNYIDGNGTPEERRAMDMLIATDEVYKRQYNELLQLNAEFAGMELDEPSMAFTYKVMETIRTENAMKPLKATINPRIIWGIAAFFIISISALLIFVLSGVNWSAGHGNGAAFNVDLQVPHVENYMNGTVLKVFVLFDIVLALFLADGYLRKKLNSKQAQ